MTPPQGLEHKFLKLSEYTIVQSQREKSFLLTKATSAIYFLVHILFYWCPLMKLPRMVSNRLEWQKSNGTVLTNK